MKPDATLTAILPLARAGWRLFPVASRSKEPAIKNWQTLATTDETRLREWQETYPRCNWAVATGAGSGVWVLDVDGEAGTEWYSKERETRGDAWTQTPKVKTARGLHLYFRWPEDGTVLRNSVAKIAPGVDTRGEGGYTLIPPSIHPTGTAYLWLTPPTIAVLPAVDWSLSQAKNASKLESLPVPANVSGVIPEGERNSTLASLAGSMRRRGMTEQAITAALTVENSRCSPPLPTDEVKRIAASVARYPESKLRTRPIRNVAVDGDWRSKLICSESGNPARVLGNAVTALRYAPDLAGLLAYDEFAQRAVNIRQTPWRTGPGEWKDIDDLNLTAWLGEQSIFLSSKVTAEAAEIVAADRRVHPVREFLDGCARGWDGQPRIGTWLSTYLGCADSRYVQEVGPRWLLGGVARIFQPGCLNDAVLLLEGRQGARKSTALRTLAGDEWFTDNISAFGSKDSREELLGIWICELSELDRIRGAALERVKGFLSTCADHFRKSYGRRAGTYPRSTVFCGSTNDSAYLADETGARRFWPVKIGEIKIDDLARDRAQLWGEANVRYRNREPWWLSPETEALAQVEQGARFEGGVLDDVIGSWIARLSDSRFEPKRRDDFETLPWFGSRAGCVNITDILVHAVGKNPAELRKGDEMAAGRFLRSRGWTMRREGSGTNRGRRYYHAPNSEGAE